MFDAHRERFALAVVQRQNETAFFAQMISTMAQVQNPKLRETIARRLEEVYIIGLKEKREIESKVEDDTLAELAKQVLVVDRNRTARWEERR